MAKVAALPIVHDAKQSTIWLGALLGMFVLYLAMNNRLAVYWSLLTGGTGAAVSGATQPGSTTTPSTGDTSGGSGSAGRLYISPGTPSSPSSTDTPAPNQGG